MSERRLREAKVTYNFGNLFASAASEETSQTDQPVGTYAAEEYDMPLWSDSFLGSKFDGLSFVCCIGEDIGIANENAHNEQRASEVTEEGDGPVFKHLKNACTTVKGRYRCKLEQDKSEEYNKVDGGSEAHHEASCTQIRTSQNDSNEAEREDQSREQFDHSRGVFLIPRCCVDDGDCSTGESEDCSCHKCARECLVDTHSGFCCSHP
jgi:hypothetical protein